MVDAASAPKASSIESRTYALVLNATALMAPYANIGAVRPRYRPRAPSCATKLFATHIAPLVVFTIAVVTAGAGAWSRAFTVSSGCTNANPTMPATCPAMA